MPDPDAHPDRVDVVVVGAGVCGLVTAAALRQRELTPLVIEARDRIGGRVMGVPGYEAVDLGPAWYWPHHHHVARLVDDLGLASFVQPTDGETIMDAGPGRTPQRAALPATAPPPYRIRGGVMALVRALRVELKETAVWLASPVEHIERVDDAIQVTTSGTASRTVSASACVVAIPPALAARTLDLHPPLETRRRRMMEATPTWMSWSMKAALVYEEATWQRDGRSGDGLSRIGPVLQFYDATEPDVQGESAPGVLVGWMEPDQVRSLSMDERRQRVIAQASRMYGLAEPIAYAEQDWSAARYTSTPRGLPFGSLDLFGAHSHREAVWDERLHFAGAETSDESPGYLDGAIARGQQVADAVAAQLGAL